MTICKKNENCGTRFVIYWMKQSWVRNILPKVIKIIVQCMYEWTNSEQFEHLRHGLSNKHLFLRFFYLLLFLHTFLHNSGRGGLFLNSERRHQFTILFFYIYIVKISKEKLENVQPRQISRTIFIARTSLLQSFLVGHTGPPDLVHLASN